MAPHLTVTDLDELKAVILATGAFGHPWIDGIVSGLPVAYVAGLPSNVPSAGARLDMVLGRLNNDGPLADGSGIPMALFLSRLELDPIDSVVTTAKRLRSVLQLRSGGQLGMGQADWETAFDEQRILAASLFLDRDGARKRMRTLARADGPCALVINGNSRVGKSHTRNLLAYAAEATGKFRVAWVEIKKSEAASITPDWMIERMVRTAVSGTSKLPDKRDPLPRYLNDLVDWALAELGKTSNVPVWMVIDGLRHKALRDEVRALVEHLAERAATPTGQLKYRLVLIYCNPIPIMSTGCTALEETFGHLKIADAEAALQQLDAARFPTLWPSLKKKLEELEQGKKLTTPLVSALIEEALR